jgi:hypothetical protein
MQQVRMGKYLGVFAAVFISVILLAMLVLYLLDVNPGGSIEIVEVFVATFFTVMVFVRDNKRLPTREERQKLVWLSFIVSLLLVLIPVICFLAYLGFSYGLSDLMQGIAEFMPKLPVFVWILIAVFTISLSYLSVYWGYWLSTSKLGKYFLKQYAT